MPWQNHNRGYRLCNTCGARLRMIPPNVWTCDVCNYFGAAQVQRVAQFLSTVVSDEKSLGFDALCLCGSVMLYSFDTRWYKCIECGITVTLERIENAPSIGPDYDTLNTIQLDLNYIFGIEMRTTASLTWDHSVKAYRLSAPYDKPLIDFIKKTIPYQKRVWDPLTKQWIFEREYFDVLKTIVNAKFSHSRIISESDTPLPPTPSVSTLHPNDPVNAFLAIVGVQTLPMTVVEARKLYIRAIARIHPDAGGDVAEAARLNVAWNEVRKRY